MISSKIAVLIAAMVPLILEAALRALLAALTVWAGLRLLRVANVFVQKAAWGLVLLAAFAMPLAPHGRTLPALAALRLPALPLFSVPLNQTAPVAVAAPQLTPAETVEAATPASVANSAPARLARADKQPREKLQTAASAAPAVIANEFADSGLNLPASPVFNTATHTAQPATAPEPGPSRAAPAYSRVALIAWLLYLGIFSTLLMRIVVGLSSAIRLWIAAEAIHSPDVANIVGNTPLRLSLCVASPVNIGSGIVLPADYAEWDEQKLRVVLAHEHSHVRQGDFYLQLLASLYASIFWFSPLGWWLKRKLSELGEAISDRAGLEEAASRSCYAQLLLEFAALPRPTLTGVAMARSSHLTQRIERLLNESSFRQAFAAGGRRTLFAFLLVPVALFAATAMVRVEAATPAQQAQAAPQDQTMGQSTPEQVMEPAPAPDGAPIPPPPGSMQPPPPPPPMSGDDPARMSPPPPPDSPNGPNSAQGAMPPMPRFDMEIPRDAIRMQIPRDEINVRIDPAFLAEFAAAHDGARQSLRDFASMGHGEPYALVGDPGVKSHFDGNWNRGRSEEIEKARKVAHGHFLWFRHDGKSYVVDDPATVAQIEAMNKPIDDLSKQMKELGEKMRAEGAKQREMSKQSRDIAVPAPDMTKTLDELNAAVASLKAKQGGTISQQELGELQRKMGKVQGELGALQGKLMTQQFHIDGSMGKLGGQMGQLGGQMGKLAHENREKIQSVIDESLKNGKAKPVE